MGSPEESYSVPDLESALNLDDPFGVGCIDGFDPIGWWSQTRSVKPVSQLYPLLRHEVAPNSISKGDPFRITIYHVKSRLDEGNSHGRIVGVDERGAGY